MIRTSQRLHSSRMKPHPQNRFRQQRQTGHLLSFPKGVITPEIKNVTTASSRTAPTYHCFKYILYKFATELADIPHLTPPIHITFIYGTRIYTRPDACNSSIRGPNSSSYSGIAFFKTVAIYGISASLTTTFAELAIACRSYKVENCSPTRT